MSKTSKVVIVAFTLAGLGFLGYLKLNEFTIKFNELVPQINEGVARYYFPFESEVWIKDKSKRANIYIDLLSRKYLDGLHKTEVEKLLGKPDEVSSNQFVYDVPANPGKQDGKLYVFFKEDNEISAKFKTEAQLVPETKKVL